MHRLFQFPRIDDLAVCELHGLGWAVVGLFALSLLLLLIGQHRLRLSVLLRLPHMLIN